MWWAYSTDMAKNKTKTLDELTLETEKLNSQLTELYIKLQPLEIERDRLWTKFKTAQEARDTMLYADFVENSTNGLPLTQSEIDLLLIGDHKSMAAYRAASSIENNKLCLRRDGYNSKTLQASFQIKLVKGDPSFTEKTKCEIETLFPHFKTSPIEVNKNDKKVTLDGVYFGIFESSLSENGIHFAIINMNTNEYHYCTTCWHHTEHKKQFASLDELLSFIENNVYYQTLKQRDRDYDMGDDDDD